MSLCGLYRWLTARRFDVRFDPLSRRRAPMFSLPPHSGTVKAIRLLLFIVGTARTALCNDDGHVTQSPVNRIRLSIVGDIRRT